MKAHALLDTNQTYSEITGITERCQTFAIRFDEPDVKIEELICLAIADAHERLQPGETFEIRSRIFPPEVEAEVDYGRRMEPREYFVAQWGVCWYWSERMQGMPLVGQFHHTCGEPNELGGYNLIARLVT